MKTHKVFFLIVSALCFIQPVFAQAGMTKEQLATMLERMAVNAERYKQTFKDLTAEERRRFELFAVDGKLDKQNRLVADLIVYQSQRNANRAMEFRNVREVDGAPVQNQTERLEKLFVKLVKENSADKEMQRILKESTRYDFGFQLGGYLYYKSMASWKELQPFFRFEAAGQERNLLVVKFEQTEFRKGMFGLDGIFDPKKFTGPLMRGTFWVDPATAEIHQEHHEIFFRDNQNPAVTHKTIEVDYAFTPSRYEVFLPRHVTSQFFRVIKARKNEPLTVYRVVKSTSEFGDFQRFTAEGKQEQTAGQ